MSCIVVFFAGGENLLFAFHTMKTTPDKFDYLKQSFTILFRLYEIEHMQNANQVNVPSSVQYWKTIYRLYLGL